MSTALEEFGVIVAIVGGLFGILYSLIKISEWWGERKKDKKDSPRIYLDTNPGLRKTSENVDIFSLIVRNSGKVTAESVEIRLLQVIQEGIDRMENDDRYILLKLEVVKVGDSIPFNFIHDNRKMNKLITPAGNDRIFDRIDTHFIFQMTGINMNSSIQRMSMIQDQDSNQFTLEKNG